MEYQIGRTGRVIAARLFEGEGLYECIEGLAAKENIQSAAVLITGGFRKASVVIGPKQETPVIEGDFREFSGPGEVFGVGTIYSKDGRPALHIHTGIGKGDKSMIGCPRSGATTFLILEVTIIELEGITGTRKFDPTSSLNLLRFESE